MMEFWLCFVPIFFTVDALGILPVFMGMTEGMDNKTKRSVVIQSAITAIIVSLIFITIGKVILGFLKITVADFMIAGGALLFVFALRDILAYEKAAKMIDKESVGAVPLGVPMIAGPALFTMTMLLIGEYGPVITISATLANIVLAALIFLFSNAIGKILGRAGSKILSKLASIVLASIAIMVIRRGLEVFLK